MYLTQYGSVFSSHNTLHNTQYNNHIRSSYIRGARQKVSACRATDLCLSSFMPLLHLYSAYIQTTDFTCIELLVNIQLQLQTLPLAASVPVVFQPPAALELRDSLLERRLMTLLALSASAIHAPTVRLVPIMPQWSQPRVRSGVALRMEATTALSCCR